MTAFAGYWPVYADLTLADLDTAEADLADLLEAAGYGPASRPSWRLDGDRLHVGVDVMPEHAAGGDMRPWTSREAWAAEWCERWAE